jgi:ubiquinone/menaquinone biosynthesis C-methylase UbiE
MSDKNKNKSNTLDHFTKRADGFNHSAKWVTDVVLTGKMRQLAGLDTFTKSNLITLDIATGTGQVAKAFQDKVKELHGLDICQDMFAQNKFVDVMTHGDAHEMPYMDNFFDLVICRQGLQFMSLPTVAQEIYRVLRPGGIAVLAHLTSFCDLDEKETFLTQMLRNPARINFLKYNDLPNVFSQNGFKVVEVHNYETREQVVNWLDTGAIGKDRVEQAINAYQNSSQLFKNLHKVSIDDKNIFESMNMQLMKVEKLKKAA